MGKFYNIEYRAHKVFSHPVPALGEFYNIENSLIT